MPPQYNLAQGLGGCDNPVMGFGGVDWTTGSSCGGQWSPSAQGRYSVGWACGTDSLISGGELACPAEQKLVCVAP